MGIFIVLFIAVILSAVVRVKEEADSGDEVTSVYCPYCGTEILDTDECCILCGYVPDEADIEWF